MWIARDKDGKLSLFTYKPVRKTYCDESNQWWDLNENVNPEYNERMELNPKMFPGLKWKDEPVKVEITVKTL